MFRSPKSFCFALSALLLVALGFAQPALVLAQASSAGCVQTYVVQKGDWLSNIATRFLGDAKAYPAIVAATNEAAKTDSSFATITNPSLIRVGSKLCIPAGTAIPGRENAGIYTNVGPAADASNLVETLVLGTDGQVR